MQKSQPSSPTQGSPSSKPAKRGCNCKNSKCLKLYCECFALGEYCNNCNCLNCHNNSANEVIKTQTSRKEAIQSVLERNPQAFRPKISQIFPSKEKDTSRHSKGCACRRTGCLKKYCECYQAGISCSDICKCIECKNDFLSYSDLPLKRVLFRPESTLTQIAKEFIENSLSSKQPSKNECFLICQEEILATEEEAYMDSPRKKVFTYSSEFKQFELALFDNLIAAIHKVGG